MKAQHVGEARVVEADLALGPSAKVQLALLVRK